MLKVKKQLLQKTQAGAHGGCSLLLQAPVFERKREGEKGPKNSVQESKQNKTKSIQETKKEVGAYSLETRFHKGLQVNKKLKTAPSNDKNGLGIAGDQTPDFIL